jgi:hypothetical protein
VTRSSTQAFLKVGPNFKLKKKQSNKPKDKVLRIYLYINDSTTTNIDSKTNVGIRVSKSWCIAHTC